jgi:hypothetical protein
MPPRVATYNSAKVSANVNGVPISGFAKGSKVKVTRNQDSFSLDVGGDGEGCWNKGNDRSGKIEMRLMYSSLSNAYLTGLMQFDELTGKGLVPIGVRDASGASAAFASKARIVKPPEADWQDKPGEVTWVFESHDVTILLMGIE